MAMDDPFASITSECITSPTIEEALHNAPVIGVDKPCFSGIFSLDGPSLSVAPKPNTPSKIQRLPHSSLNTFGDEGLRDMPARNDSSSLPPPRFRRDDFTALIKHFYQTSDRSLGRKDILEIAESKGLSFPPPEWWRPGGYEKVP